MTKKKPDFLRDLDTAIMDELTGGGIKGNAAERLHRLRKLSSYAGCRFVVIWQSWKR